MGFFLVFFGMNILVRFTLGYPPNDTFLEPVTLLVRVGLVGWLDNLELRPTSDPQFLYTPKLKQIKIV